MIIENNAAAIRVLEPIVEQVHRMSPEQVRGFFLFVEFIYLC